MSALKFVPKVANVPGMAAPSSSAIGLTGGGSSQPNQSSDEIQPIEGVQALPETTAPTAASSLAQPMNAAPTTSGTEGGRGMQGGLASGGLPTTISGMGGRSSLASIQDANSFVAAIKGDYPTGKPGQEEKSWWERAEEGPSWGAPTSLAGGDGTHMPQGGMEGMIHIANLQEKEAIYGKVIKPFASKITKAVTPHAQKAWGAMKKFIPGMGGAAKKKPGLGGRALEVGGITAAGAGVASDVGTFGDVSKTRSQNIMDWRQQMTRR